MLFAVVLSLIVAVVDAVLFGGLAAFGIPMPGPAAVAVAVTYAAGFTRPHRPRDLLPTVLIVAALGGALAGAARGQSGAILLAATWLVAWLVLGIRPALAFQGRSTFASVAPFTAIAIEFVAWVTRNGLSPMGRGTFGIGHPTATRAPAPGLDHLVPTAIASTVLAWVCYRSLRRLERALGTRDDVNEQPLTEGAAP
jgi:hypothetical protein